MNKVSKIYIGNNNLLDNLYNAFKNKSLSNSIILSGAKGLGKSTLILYFINQVFNKESSHNKAHTANLIYNNTHPNMKFVSIEYDEKRNKFKNDININQIRNLENFAYKSSIDNLPKFIVIDSSDDLNKSSANALLKMLEEPKDNTYFILIAHQLSNILPTIRSRCIKYHMSKPNIDEFIKILRLNNVDQKIENIKFIFDLTNASPGLAIEVISEKIFQIYDNIIKILIEKKPISNEIVNLSDYVGKFSNSDFKTFLILLRFILITITKINLGYNFANMLSLKFIEIFKTPSNTLKNSTLLNILEYLNDNEKDLFAFNLDKKIFCLNIFKSLKNNS